MANKRYFWFKLGKDFFEDRNIKRLRKLAGGDTFLIIYMKMILLTLSTKGMYEISEYEDVYDSLSLDIDEDIENIKITIQFLKQCGLVEENVEGELMFTDVDRLVGSETASTIRSRKSRQKI